MYVSLKVEVKMMDFISRWHEHSMGTDGREDLEASDHEWKEYFDELMSWYVKPGTLLFRVHTGGDSEPMREDYEDGLADDDNRFKEAHDFWLKQKSPQQIDFDQHWVSFTSDVNVIGSSYFASKGLRGFVIVIKAKKALSIAHNFKIGVNEKEVVAPMDQSTLVEVLPFKAFMKKYGRGQSDYEK
jgi:hypothetical protein